MKQIYVFFLLATLFVAKVGKAEEAIPDSGQPAVAATPATVYVTGTPKLAKTAVSLTAKRVKALMAKTESLKAEVRETAWAVGGMRTDLNSNTKDVSDAANNITGLTTALENLVKKFGSWSENVKDHVSAVAWILGGAIVLCILGLGIYLAALLNRRSEEITAVVRAGVTETRADIAVVRDDIGTIPAAVHTYFDPKPFDGNVFGHHFVLEQGADALAEKSGYEVLHVKVGSVDAAVTVAEYQLQKKSNRNDAFDSIKNSVKEYKKGDLAKRAANPDSNIAAAATLEIALIESFAKSERLVITKL